MVGDAARGEELFAQPGFRLVELRDEFVEVDVEPVARLVVGEGNAVAVEDAAADGGNADGAEALGFLALAVFRAGEDLDLPEPGGEHEQTEADTHRDDAEWAFPPVDLVEDEHGSGAAAFDLAVGPEWTGSGGLVLKRGPETVEEEERGGACDPVEKAGHRELERGGRAEMRLASAELEQDAGGERHHDAGAETEPELRVALFAQQQVLSGMEDEADREHGADADAEPRSGQRVEPESADDGQRGDGADAVSECGVDDEGGEDARRRAEEIADERKLRLREYREPGDDEEHGGGKPTHGCRTHTSSRRLRLATSRMRAPV